MEILGYTEFIKNKHLILEQDDTMGAAPPPPSPAGDIPPSTSMPPTDDSLGSVGGAMDPFLPEDPNQQTAISKPAEPYKFVFIQDAAHKKWHGHSDKNGGTKRFSTYSIDKEELTKWIDSHAGDYDPEKIKAALEGKRKMPSLIYSKFKKDVLAGDLGTDKGPIDISFDSDTDFDNPSTDDLSVVFLRSTK